MLMFVAQRLAVFFIVASLIFFEADEKPGRSQSRIRISRLERLPGRAYKTRMTLKAIIHKETAGGFWGEVPSLPGCDSQGETVAKLLANLRDVAQGGLAVLSEEGRSPA